jgi:uncharacterized protein involved in outer membrane biogenesis
MAEPNVRPAKNPRPRTPPPGRRGRGRPDSRLDTRGASTPASEGLKPTGRGWRDIPAPVRWVGSALLLLVLAIAIFVSVFQWNWLRGPVGHYLSGRMHRTVVLHGDLSARPWSWQPSATADDVTVAQPDWAGAGQMIVIPRLTVSVDLKALLGGKLILPLVDAERPIITMRRDATGRNNWTFGTPTAGSQALKLPPIRHFTINAGRLTLDDASRKLHFIGAVSSNEQLTGYGRGRFTLTGDGSLNGTSFQARVLGGPLINVNPDQAYPFNGDVRAGATHIMAQGTITHPFDFGVMQAATHITGPDMAELYDLTGLALPNSPPYDLYGDMKRNQNRFDLTALHGRLGETDVAGHITVTDVKGRRDLTGEITSRRLKLADFTAVLGGAPKGVLKGTVTSPQQQAMAAKLTAEHRILPDARLDVTRVRQMDADVRYHAESVDAGPLPIRGLSLHARLDHGLLTIDPLSLTLPQGALSGHVTLDARKDTPQVALDLAIARAQLAELLPKSGGTPPLEGTLEARARLTGSGDSVRSVAAASNGAVAVAIPQGQMRQLFAELERILSDTGEVQATGKGVIDLRNETLSLSLSGKPKHFRLVRIAAPITLTGRLDAPKVGVDLGKAAPQLAAGALLGAFVAPIAAVLPFIAGGTAKDANCAALLEEAQTHGAPIG